MVELIEIWNFILQDAALAQIFQVIATLCAILFGVSFLLSSQKSGVDGGIEAGRWLPSPEMRSKYLCEVWFLAYGVFWISVFMVIIAFQLYNFFDKIHYLAVLGLLAAPLYIQPVLWPSLTGEKDVNLLDRYSFKANLWIGIFGAIGNYWYTHYFYTVLKASYTFKSWDINGVPIPMFLATHFYFTFYHTLSNMALRKVRTRYAEGTSRLIFEWILIFTMSYITAFMEALTISGFPCYSFQDRHMAWVLGSAFYGIYFIVSFPMFARVDEPTRFTSFQTCTESLASGMMVLWLLDLVRVALGLDLVMALNRPCKLNASFTCAPFTGQLC